MIFLNEIYRKFGAYFTNITLGVGANWRGSLFEGGAYSKEGAYSKVGLIRRRGLI